MKYFHLTEKQIGVIIFYIKHWEVTYYTKWRKKSMQMLDFSVEKISVIKHCLRKSSIIIKIQR